MSDPSLLWPVSAGGMVEGRDRRRGVVHCQQLLGAASGDDSRADLKIADRAFVGCIARACVLDRFVDTRNDGAGRWAARNMREHARLDGRPGVEGVRQRLRRPGTDLCAATVSFEKTVGNKRLDGRRGRVLIEVEQLDEVAAIERFLRHDATGDDVKPRRVANDVARMRQAAGENVENQGPPSGVVYTTL